MTTSTTPAPVLTGLADFFTRWNGIHSTASATPAVQVSPGLAVQLEAFFAAWAERPNALSVDSTIPEPLSVQLRRFLGAWQRLERPIEPQRPAPAIDWATRALELQRFFQDLQPALQAQAEQRRLGAASNVWTAGGLGRDEVRNSKVLAWLLDCRGNHGQKASILAALLDGIVPCAKAFPGSATTDLPYWTHLESCPMGERDSRVDIEIDGEGLLLFIEVKIGAMETSDQLDRYLGIARAKARGRPWGVIYLTRLGQLPPRFRGAAGEVPLVPVSWREVIGVIERHYQILPDCFARHMLRQFAGHIRSFS